jgi:nucleotide-binding universal stress UspA family protein
MNKVEKIFVPTDFSPCSQEAIAYAVFLAGQLNATILLTHVLEPISYPIDFAMIEYADYDQMKTVQALDRIARSWRQKGIQIETHLFKGDPVTEIVKKAKDLECDLIVMGTHGRTGMAHLMMGSVAERIVRTSSVPVLTVRQRMGKATERISEEEEVEAPVAAGTPGHWGIII